MVIMAREATEVWCVGRAGNALFGGLVVLRLAGVGW